MDSARVIRVHIERSPVPPPLVEQNTQMMVGGLGEELARLEAALASGNHLGFEWPTWMHRAKAGVVQTVPPPAAASNAAATLEFQQKVQAYMQKMLELLQTMADIMATPQAPPPAAPACLPVPPVSASGEMFYPFPPNLGVPASWQS